jgi:hypothetical protein
MMFWDPTTSRFSVSPGYSLDPTKCLADPFPELHDDGGFTPALVSGHQPPKEPFPPGAQVYAMIDSDVYKGRVILVPTPPAQWYSIKPTGDSNPINVPPLDVSSPNDPMLHCDRHLDQSSKLPQLPRWITNDSRLILNVDDIRQKGFLQLHADSNWTFIQRNTVGRITYRHDLNDLPTTWRNRILDGSLELAWQKRIWAHHVSAKGLLRGVPNSFKQSMGQDFNNRMVWLESHVEEYTDLREHGTFDILTEAEYRAKYSHIAIIPTMNVQTVKKDEDGLPIRAKSRIVVLGNLEESIWSKSYIHAPVIRKESDCLLTTMAIERGRIQKQGDCKNAFCHPILPDDEIAIVRPPPGCPISKPGEYSLLRKTLYGLRRSPKHWYETLAAALIKVGLSPCKHDPCVFTGSLLTGEPPLYLGVYVDDFTYFSDSDNVEKAFEQSLSMELQVDFMGDIAWFLGKCYDWQRTEDDLVTVSITQTAKIESMLEEFDLLDCNVVRSPYRSGLTMNYIALDHVPPGNKPEAVKPYQRLVGGLNWLAISTRPDLSVSVSLLSQFVQDPSKGHMDAGKRVLAWLSGTRNHGLWFTQGGKFSENLAGWVDQPEPTSLAVSYTDANWGPQDASHPREDIEELVDVSSVHSLLGHVVIRTGGPIAWGCQREPKTSRSSCETAIYCMDEGCKTSETLFHLMTDLGMSDIAQPISMFNDHRGAVDWSSECTVSKKLWHLNIREVAV